MNHRNLPLLHHASGFTLAELAIVLIIVTLLTTGLVSSLGTQRSLAEIRTTEKMMAEAQEALIGYALANGRLPRPAPLVDGVERAAVCTNDADCTGFLPWQALGIQRTDAWGKVLRYSVTPAFANSSFMLNTAGSKKVFTRDDTGALTSLSGPAGACNGSSTPCAAAVIFSHGQNRLGTTIDGATLGGATASSLDEASNDTGSSGATAGTIFISRTFTDNTAASGGEFDDLVTWLSPNILYNRMIAAGKLP